MMTTHVSQGQLIISNYWMRLSYDMKNYMYADLGGCYLPQPSASVDNTLLDLHNSSSLLFYYSFKIFPELQMQKMNLVWF